MDTFHFTCCHCAARLRIRDRLYVGRQIHCPECRRPLLLVEVGGELRVNPVVGVPINITSSSKHPMAEKRAEHVAAVTNTEPAGTQISTPTTLGPKAIRNSRALQNVHRLAAFWKREPLVAIGSVFALCAAVMVCAFLLRRDRPDEMAAHTPSGVAMDDAASLDPQERLEDGSSTSKTAEITGQLDPPQKNNKSTSIAESHAGANAPVQVVGLVPPQSEKALSQNEIPLLPELALSSESPVAEAGPQPREIDVNAALDQPIELFDQPRVTPLQEVLTHVAEMAGAVVAYDADELDTALAKLAQPVALKLQKTTVRGILERLLQPAGLTFQVKGRVIKLMRSPPAATN